VLRHVTNGKTMLTFAAHRHHVDVLPKLHYSEFCCYSPRRPHCYTLSNSYLLSFYDYPTLLILIYT